uniref:Uncharacterized protein n=1 Tax=viral metagenome TaxID=1070528 RepID=A0A6M3L7G9_9ZZZZ
MPKKGSHHTKGWLEKNLGKESVWREWCHAYIEHKDLAVATQKVYGDTIVDHKRKGFRLWENPEVRAILCQILEINNATPAEAALRIAEAMNATRTVGSGDTEREVPDHPVRLRASDMVLKAYDAYPRPQSMPSSGGGSKHLHIYLQEPKAVQKFIVTHNRMPSDAEREQLEDPDEGTQPLREQHPPSHPHLQEQSLHQKGVLPAHEPGAEKSGGSLARGGNDQNDGVGG